MSDSPREIDFCVRVCQRAVKWRSGDYCTTGLNLGYRDVERGLRSGAWRSRARKRGKEQRTRGGRAGKPRKSTANLYMKTRENPKWR